MLDNQLTGKILPFGSLTCAENVAQAGIDAVFKGKIKHQHLSFFVGTAGLPQAVGHDQGLRGACTLLHGMMRHGSIPGAPESFHLFR